MSGWGIAGGEAAAGVLERMLGAGRLPHALLFTGPPQAGKGTLARALAQALNCEAGGPAPCGTCRACRRIAEGKHADVEAVGPGAVCRVADHDHSQSQVIGICVVRRLEMTAARKPFEGRQRVFLVDPAEALTPEAADAFLKTLEEPPPGVTFVLVSARPETLSATVRSRCREVRVDPLPVAALAAWLATQGLEEPRAAALARLAQGRPGRALALLAEGDPLALRSAQAVEIRRLATGSRAERLSYAEAVAGRGLDPANALTALAHWTDWWRDLLLVQAGCEDRAAHQESLEALRDTARRYGPGDVARFLRALQETAARLRGGAQPRLCLEALLLRLPAAAGGAA